MTIWALCVGEAWPRRPPLPAALRRHHHHHQDGVSPTGGAAGPFPARLGDSEWPIITALAFGLAVTIVAANTLLIIVLRSTASLRTLSNVYITSLAVVDLLVGASVVPYAFSVVPYTEASFGRHPRLCLAMLSLSMATMLMSALHLVLIAVDRCARLKVPSLYAEHYGGRGAAAAVGSVWLFGALYVSLPQAHLPLHEPIEMCYVTAVMPVQYVVFVNGALYFASLFVIVALYAVILHITRRQRKEIESLISKRKNPARKTAAAVDAVRMKAVKTAGSLGAILSRFNKRGKAKPDRKTSGDDIGLGSGTSMAALTDPSGASPSSTAGRDVTSSVDARKSHFGGAEVEDSSASKEGLGEISDSGRKIRKQNVVSIKVEFNEEYEYPRHRRRNFQMFQEDMKIIASVSAVYFLCVTPSCICMSVSYYVHVEEKIYHSLNLLALANAAANFFIFCVHSSAFRKTLYELFVMCEI